MSKGVKGGLHVLPFVHIPNLRLTVWAPNRCRRGNDDLALVELLKPNLWVIYFKLNVGKRAVSWHHSNLILSAGSESRVLHGLGWASASVSVGRASKWPFF